MIIFLQVHNKALILKCNMDVKRMDKIDIDFQG